MKGFLPQKAYLVCMVIMSVFVSILSGCGGGGGGVWTEPVVTPSSVTVSITAPADGATLVFTNTNLTATFSGPMDPATLISPATSFTLNESVSGTAVPGAVTYIGNTATFNPNSDLLTNTKYSATITTAAKDLAGKPLAKNFTWTFTTGLTADTTAPTLLTTGAADGDTGLPINRNSTATFSEPMDPATLISPATSFTLKESVSGTPVAGVVTYIGNTATFNPNSDLKPNTRYTSTITTAAKDLAGNALVSGPRANPWSWTTGATADLTAPTVTVTDPVNLATNVPVGQKINATFSEEMRQTTIVTANFTVKETVSGIAVPGTVSYVVPSNIATFSPLANLKADTSYTVTVSNGANDLAGNALVVPAASGTANPWTFRTLSAPVLLPLNPTAPNLGEAGRFVILASQAVTTTGTTAVSNGDIGIIDIQRSGITGFTPSGPAGNYVELTNGTSYAFDDVNPAPFPNPLHFSTPVVGAPWTTTGAMITQVRTDMGIANTFLAADPNPGAPTQVCPIELGGLFLTRGVYKTASNVGITTGPLHLDAQGDPNSVFIFSTNGTFTTGASGSIILDNGAQARNVYFRTAGITTIAAGTTFFGNVFAGTQVNVLSGAHVTGRLFGVTDRVTLIADIVTKAP